MKPIRRRVARGASRMRGVASPAAKVGATPHPSAPERRLSPTCALPLSRKGSGSRKLEVHLPRWTMALPADDRALRRDSQGQGNPDGSGRRRRAPRRLTIDPAGSCQRGPDGLDGLRTSCAGGSGRRCADRRRASPRRFWRRFSCLSSYKTDSGLNRRHHYRDFMLRFGVSLVVTHGKKVRRV